VKLHVHLQQVLESLLGNLPDRSLGNRGEDGIPQLGEECGQDPSNTI